MRRALPLILASLALVSGLCAAKLDQYNVVWTTQSENTTGSMPVGGGDIGLNAWVEDGDLLFYIGRSGSLDENNARLKLGRVRVKLDPNPFAAGGKFRQELKLRDGYIEIAGEAGGVSAKIDVWVEVTRPVCHVEVESSRPVQAEAIYEGWRTKKRRMFDFRPIMGMGLQPGRHDNYRGEVWMHTDTVDFDGDGVLFYHRNDNSDLTIDKELAIQELAPYKKEIPNPIRDRTFGGRLSGKNMEPAGKTSGHYYKTDYQGWRLRSRAASRKHAVTVSLHTGQTPALSDWKAGLQKLTEVQPDRQKTTAWWNQFWERSHIVINPKKADSEGWRIARNYQLFRYMLGCNAYGEYPTKFNGGHFTVDPHYMEVPEPTPDFRFWGGGSFTAQNQRLVYWPMLVSGDFDMMHSQFDFYRRALGGAEARVRHFWDEYGVKGAMFAEQLNNFGTPCGSVYGWTDEIRKTTPRGIEQMIWHEYNTVSQLEFAYMILEYERFTGKDISRWMPFIESSVIFMDTFYQFARKYNFPEGDWHRKDWRPDHKAAEARSGLDENGKLVIFPSTANETFRRCTNATPMVAGLHAVADRLVELDEKYFKGREYGRDYYRGLQARIPEVATERKFRDEQSKVVETFAAAKTWLNTGNREFPHIYPIFPFGLVSLDGQDLDIARNTWRHTRYQPHQMEYICWHQTNIVPARLGLVSDARNYNTKKFLHDSMRFPAFWITPHFDQEPDHDHGGAAMIGLQEMLMQTVGDKIRLLPAWPKDWDADFKLNAPGNTVIEGTVRNGKVSGLKVTPESRRADVIVLAAQ